MNPTVRKLLEQAEKESLAFFVLFSRFEYALKREGYVMPKKEKAEANWDAFAKNLGKRFFDDVSKFMWAPTLLLTPPKHQVVKNGKLDWKSAEKIETVHQLFVAIRRVRNNLFHGGKFPIPHGPVTDISRNKKLLSESINVLERALSCRPKLKASFDELVQ